MTLIIDLPAFTQTTAETDVDTTPSPSCPRDCRSLTVLPLRATKGCPLTNGGDCPESQAEIDKCPEC